MRAAKSDIDMEDLARRIRELDEDAYREFSDYFGPRFRSMFLKRGLQMADAEELAVSCITDISLNVEQYKTVEGGSFEAWVFTLARHAYTNRWRALKEADALPENLPSPTTGEDESGPNPELISAVQEALARLSDTDRAVIETRDFGGEQTFAEVGGELSVKVGTARQRHRRALKRLQKLLEQDARIIRHLDRRGVTRAEKSHG